MGLRFYGGYINHENAVLNLVKDYRLLDKYSYHLSRAVKGTVFSTNEVVTAYLPSIDTIVRNPLRGFKMLWFIFFSIFICSI